MHVFRSPCYFRCRVRKHNYGPTCCNQHEFTTYRPQVFLHSVQLNWTEAVTFVSRAVKLTLSTVVLCHRACTAAVQYVQNVLAKVVVVADSGCCHSFTGSDFLHSSQSSGFRVLYCTFLVNVRFWDMFCSKSHLNCLLFHNFKSCFPNTGVDYHSMLQYSGDDMFSIFLSTAVSCFIFFHRIFAFWNLLLAYQGILT